ncbi:MAG: four helix bundle protein [Opitutaceae bacterium]|nr:four helix bundle protein [Opitutaceae bacterium]
MSTFKRFEDIESWQTGRKLRRLIYSSTRKPAFAADRDLVSQIRRAAQSITSNIAEGFDRGGNKEFAQFLCISKGSVAEVKDQLYTAIDEGYIDQAEFDAAYALAESVTHQIGGLLRYLHQTELRGPKFKTSAQISKREIATFGTLNSEP